MPEEISDLAAMRVSYAGGADLDTDMLDDGWLALAQKWLADAITAELPEPNAIVLGTVDSRGFPATRTVLCKALSTDGVVFYTNFGSAKGVDIAGTPYASATFPWIGIQRQMTVRGPVEHVDDVTTEQYFHSRPRGSQLGAWASEQSHPIRSREALEAALADVTDRFDGKDIPVPTNWGGFRIRPDTVEFWQGRNNRLHNRIRVTLGASGTTEVERLQP